MNFESLKVEYRHDQLPYMVMKVEYRYGQIIFYGTLSFSLFIFASFYFVTTLGATQGSRVEIHLERIFLQKLKEHI